MMSSDPNNKSDTNIETIEPTLQFFVLCDNIAEAGKKPVFVGVFNQILHPGPINQFTIAMRWINGFGKHKQEIQILDPELRKIVHFENEMEIKHRIQPANVFINIVDFMFPIPGVYWFKVLLNNKLITSIPLPVHEGK